MLQKQIVSGEKYFEEISLKIYFEHKIFTDFLSSLTEVICKIAIMIHQIKRKQFQIKFFQLVLIFAYNLVKMLNCRTNTTLLAGLLVKQ